MKIIDYRDPQGKFARRRRVKKNRIIVLFLVIIAIVGILGYKSSWTSIEPQQVRKLPQCVRTLEDGINIEYVECDKQNDITPEQEAQLKKQYELSIKETTLLNKKVKLESDIANIEKELEGVRAESLSLK